MFYVKYLFYLILVNFVLVTPQLNLYYTDSVSTPEKEKELQHDCLRANANMNNMGVIREIISYCMSKLSSEFDIEPFHFHAKLTFVELAKENITSQQLLHWSAPIDLIEHYQFYLNKLSTFNDSFLANKIFYNCTWPRFGPKCQYELYTRRPEHSFLYDIIHDFYQTVEYNPTNMTCYEHLQCNRGPLPACLDWTEICNGRIDCLDGGLDEEHCWLLEINECKDDEFRCENGQCIPQSFYLYDVSTADCLDTSDEDAPPSIRFHCPTNEPSFTCEDIMCKDTLLTSSCSFTRHNLLFEAIYSNTNNSTSEECWLASKCILKVIKSLETICRNLCANNACINTILNTCPDILYIPNSPSLFGHFYFAFNKSLVQTENIWLFYICYTTSYYDTFFDMIPKISLNNRTCFLYKTVSHSSIQSVFENKFLKELYSVFQKYNLIDNYNSTICNRWNMYQCINSSKCISVYRLFNTIYDCPYMDDENIIFINNSNAIKQIQTTHFKCQTSNKYIPRWFVRNHVCDCGHSETGWCEDEFYNSIDPYINISFQTVCDGYVELLPIIINERNETDETECQPWQCDNIYTHCDRIWNCLDGADEINCDLSSKCPTDHHLCISPYTNQLMCLHIEKFNDGKIDCLGATDEIKLCRKEFYGGQSGHFYCINQTSISCLYSNSLCDGKNNCDYGDDEQFCEKNRTLPPNFRICGYEYSSLKSDVEKFLCNRLEFPPKERIIYFQLGRTLTNSIVYKTKNNVLSDLSNIQVSDQHQSHCQRGLDLRVWLNNNSTKNTCLCPPSYYGSQCQYQNQRISLIIKFRALSDSYQTLFAIVISLIDDTNERIVHSYEQITYLSVSHCKIRYNIYLLYATRPKNSTKTYSVHIDFYEKISLKYRGSVLLSVNFPFLPVHRLAFLVDVPSSDDKTPNSFKYECVHGKRIQYSNSPDNPTFCQCEDGWSGRYCTIEYTCNCASDSACLGVSASNRSICVCPANKFGPRCLLTNTICQNNSLCQNGGQCIANDEYLVSEQNFTCLCRKGFRGDRCEIVDNKLILSFDKNIVLTQSIFIHFIQVTTYSEPVRLTTFRTISFQQDALTIYWSKPFHLVFIDFEKKDFYLIVNQMIYNQSATVHPSNRCPSIREVLNETIVQWHLIRRIKYYHLPCQNQSLNLSCL